MCELSTTNQPLTRCSYLTSMGRNELAKARDQYAKLTLENARRLLRFWQVRPVGPAVKPN